MDSQGVDTTEEKPRESLFAKTLKVVNTPGAFTRSLIKEGVDSEAGVDWGRVLEGSWKDQTEGIDLLDEMGLAPQEGDGFGRKAARFALGLGADILTDPLSYVSGGITGALKVGLPFAKGAQVTSKGLVKAAKLPQAFKALRATSIGQKTIEPLADAAGKMFSTTYGRNPELVEGVNALQNRVTRRTQELSTSLRDIAKRHDLTPDEQNLLTRFAEEPTIRDTVQVRPQVRQAFDELEGIKKGVITDPEVQRGILTEGTLRENYHPHINIAKEADKLLVFGRKISAEDLNTTRREIEGTVESINAERAAMGKAPLFDPNALTSTFVRGSKAIRAVEGYDFVEGVLQRFGKKVDDLATEAGIDAKSLQVPAGYTVWEGTGNLKQLGKVVLPDDVARELEHVQKFYINATDEGTQAFLKAFDWLTSKWKPFVTLRNPAFHVNNLIGNAWNMYLGGIDPHKLPTKLAQGFDVLKGKDGAIKTAFGTLDYNQVRGLAMDHGVLGHTFLGGNQVDEMRKALAGELGAETKKWYQKWIDDLGKAAGMNIEESSKLALFIDQLQNGSAKDLQELASQAALHTKKYLFDYSDLTQFEKNVLRRVFPFIAWTRKNIPLQVSELLAQPGKYARLEQIRHNADNLTEDDGSPRPQFLQEALKTPFKTGDGAPIYFNPRLPAQDLARLAPGDSGREMLGMLNPLLKVPLELATGQNFFTGRDIERYPGETTEVIGGARVPTKAAFATKELFGAAGRPLDIATALADDADATDRLRALRFFFPGVYTFDPRKERANSTYREVDRLRNLVRKYEDETGKQVPTKRDLTSRIFSSGR